jgi:hypothetical protein
MRPSKRGPKTARKMGPWASSHPLGKRGSWASRVRWVHRGRQVGPAESRAPRGLLCALPPSVLSPRASSHTGLPASSAPHRTATNTRHRIPTVPGPTTPRLLSPELACRSPRGARRGHGPIPPRRVTTGQPRSPRSSPPPQRIPRAPRVDRDRLGRAARRRPSRGRSGPRVMDGTQRRVGPRPLAARPSGEARGRVTARHAAERGPTDRSVARRRGWSRGGGLPTDRWGPVDGAHPMTSGSGRLVGAWACRRKRAPFLFLFFYGFFS